MKRFCPKTTSKLFFLLLFFFLLPFFLQSPVRAQEAISLTVKPVRIGDDNSLLLSPGEKKQIQVRVENNSGVDLQIDSQVFDFIVDEDGTTPVKVFDQQDNRWSLANWITLAPARNFLQAGGATTVNVLIEVPEDATPGGHYAMIVHGPVRAKVEEQTGTGIGQEAGTLIYVLIDGPIKESAFVSLFDVPKFLEKGPVPMTISLKNESDIHITPVPQIAVRNIFGKEIDSFSLGSKNVFPFTERDFSDVWQKKWGFGPYTISLEAAYGLQGQVMTAQRVIWIIPVSIIIIILVGVLLIMAIVMAVRKKQDKKAPIKGMETETQPMNDQDQEEL